MDFNTSTLGYKLISGKLRERRKHSEQLGKYLAGLLDADGCFSLYCSQNKKVRLTISLSQSLSNDPDGQLLRALQEFYGLGKIYYKTSNNDNWASVATWLISGREAVILLNRIKKHLRLKATHADNLNYLYEELKGLKLTDAQIDELKDMVSNSRLTTRWIKQPKHLSWAWMAGFFDGDGCYSFDTSGKKNILKLTVALHESDSFILEQLKKQFKGSLVKRKDGTWCWVLALGKQSASTAMYVLPKLRKYSCIPKKYEAINKIIEFHNDNRQQRLNELRANSSSDSPDN